MVSPMMVIPAAMILLVLRCHTAEGTAVWCILPLAGNPHGGDPEGTVGGGRGARGGSRGKVRAVMVLEAVVVVGGDRLYTEEKVSADYVGQTEVAVVCGSYFLYNDFRHKNTHKGSSEFVTTAVLNNQSTASRSFQ